MTENKYTNYTVIDATTGLVKRTGSSKVQDIDIITSDSTERIVLSIPPDPETYRWNGSTWIQVPKRPIFPASFNILTNSWEDARNIDQLKLLKWSQIKLLRDKQEFGGFIWNGHIFDSDEISQQRIIGAVQLANTNPNYSVLWTLADNTTITLTAQDMLAVSTSLAQHVTQTHQIAQQLREQINQAASAAELDLIQWPN